MKNFETMLLLQILIIVIIVNHYVLIIFVNKLKHIESNWLYYIILTVVLFDITFNVNTF